MYWGCRTKIDTALYSNKKRHRQWWYCIVDTILSLSHPGKLGVSYPPVYGSYLCSLRHKQVLEPLPVNHGDASSPLFATVLASMILFWGNFISSTCSPLTPSSLLRWIKKIPSIPSYGHWWGGVFSIPSHQVSMWRIVRCLNFLGLGEPPPPNDHLQLFGRCIPNWQDQPQPWASNSAGQQESRCAHADQGQRPQGQSCYAERPMLSWDRACSHPLSGRVRQKCTQWWWSQACEGRKGSSGPVSLK